MISTETRKKLRDRTEFCAMHTEHLDDWELDFIDRVGAIQAWGKDLTGKQARMLGRIFRKIEEEVG